MSEPPVIVRPPTKAYWVAPTFTFVVLLACLLTPVTVAWRRGEPLPTWLFSVSVLIPTVIALGQLWHLASQRITFLPDGIELRRWLRPTKSVPYPKIDGYYPGFTLRVSQHPQSKVLSRSGHALKIHGRIIRLYALDPPTLEAEFRKRGVPILDAKTFYRRSSR